MGGVSPLRQLAGAAFGAGAFGAGAGAPRAAAELALLVANGEGEVGLLVDHVIDAVRPGNAEV